MFVSQPAAYVSLLSVYEWDAEKNKQLSLEFTQSVSELLSVPTTRMFIHLGRCRSQTGALTARLSPICSASRLV